MFALVPSQESSNKYIQASQNLFGAQDCDHLLSEESTPHVTICQFECFQKQVINIWEEFKKLSQPSFTVRFVSLSLIQGIGEHENFYWAELSAARNTPLLNLYQMAIGFIQKKGLTLINDYGDYYRPHLTLARIRLPYTINKWPISLLDAENFDLDFMPCLL